MEPASRQLGPGEVRVQSEWSQWFERRNGVSRNHPGTIHNPSYEEGLVEDILGKPVKQDGSLAVLFANSSVTTLCKKSNSLLQTSRITEPLNFREERLGYSSKTLNVQRIIGW